MRDDFTDKLLARLIAMKPAQRGRAIAKLIVSTERQAEALDLLLGRGAGDELREAAAVLRELAR